MIKIINRIKYWIKIIKVIKLKLKIVVMEKVKEIIKNNLKDNIKLYNNFHLHLNIINKIKNLLIYIMKIIYLKNSIFLWIISLRKLNLITKI
jgi:hypothetical protein